MKAICYVSINLRHFNQSLKKQCHQTVGEVWDNRGEQNLHLTFNYQHTEQRNNKTTNKIMLRYFPFQLHRLTFWSRYSKAERVDIDEEEEVTSDQNGISMFGSNGMFSSTYIIKIHVSG